MTPWAVMHKSLSSLPLYSIRIIKKSLRFCYSWTIVRINFLKEKLIRLLALFKLIPEGNWHFTAEIFFCCMPGVEKEPLFIIATHKARRRQKFFITDFYAICICEILFFMKAPISSPLSYVSGMRSQSVLISQLSRKNNITVKAITRFTAIFISQILLYNVAWLIHCPVTVCRVTTKIWCKWHNQPLIKVRWIDPDQRAATAAFDSAFFY